ncbi:colicin I receptor precursor [mine drainage metagenome]|uniref:Colicin I receptor n=1 Tax=mine drainage metagenome TaxID=410659 RepID=A0A1J5SUN4_9ZZZZ
MTASTPGTNPPPDPSGVARTRGCLRCPAFIDSTLRAHRLSVVPFVAAAFLSFASARAEDLPLSELKQMNLEQLMEVQVTTASRHPEDLFHAASAIQVISGADIRSSGFVSLPDVLSLAPGLEVARANSSQWAISARGFDNVLADKLLVMIDGRTVYTPLYAGVFWDVQNTFLEDIDRIEVVDGPGGAQWGANAVNGVIDVITKDARRTQGLYVEGGGGGDPTAFAGLRYGGRLAPGLFYRVYVHSLSRAATTLLNGADAGDAWAYTQGGYRMDWERTDADHVTLQGDFYGADPNPTGTNHARASGANVLGRWTHRTDGSSTLQLQAYFDRTWRDFGGGFREGLDTYDVDWQDDLRFDSGNHATWGFGARLMDDRVDNAPAIAFLPAHRRLHVTNLFAEDEMPFAGNHLRATVGAKLEHDDYEGLNIQPDLRLAWLPSDRQTVWASVSRAVRTPSRIDEDFALYAAPGRALIQGNPDFESETLVAWELGWRMHATDRLTLSLSTYLNQYSDLRTARPSPQPPGLPITFGNDLSGRSYGAELTVEFQPTDAWHLRGGYTILRKSLWLSPGAVDLNHASAESDDPAGQALVQFTLRLPHNLSLGSVVRWVHSLPSPHVPGYTSVDLRLAWHATKSLEIAVVGQNLLDRRHPEFVPSSPSPREIGRSGYGKVVWRY